MMIFKNFVELQNENAVAEKLGITQPTVTFLSLIHISEPTRRTERSRMPSSA